MITEEKTIELTINGMPLAKYIRTQVYEALWSFVAACTFCLIFNDAMKGFCTGLEINELWRWVVVIPACVAIINYFKGR